MDLSERPRDASSQTRRHPWELARFQFFREVLRESGLRPAELLDAGAGDGWFAEQLSPFLPSSARVTCWDAHYSPADLAELSRARPRIRFTAARPSERFELITLLDVLEHVADDRPFLSALVQENLSDGGAVLLSVPAWQTLFTSHDTQLRHFRRYAPRAIASVIEDSGLTIVRRGGLFHSLLLPRAAEKVRELLSRKRPPAQDAPTLAWQGGPLLTRAIDWALAADNHLSLLTSRAGVELAGLSWWALCKRT